MDDETGIKGEQIEVGEDEREARKRFHLVSKFLNKPHTITKVKHRYSKADWKMHQELVKKISKNE